MREPKPYWKASHSCWYVKINGRHHRLDPDKEKAWELYHQLMAGTREVGPNTMVLELMAEFLAHSKRVNEPSTYENYKAHLESFYKSIGKLRVSSVKPLHVERWLAKRYAHTTNGSTLNGAVRAVARLFNWAKKSGRIPKSPLEGMEQPKPTMRDVYLMPDQFKKLIVAIPKGDPRLRDHHARDRLPPPRSQDRGGPPLRRHLLGLPRQRSQRSNRPAGHPVEREGAGDHKTAGPQEPRRPDLPQQLGSPGRKRLIQQCKRMTKKLGFHVCPYAIRHTFATDAIIRGVDIVTIAELMGHKSLKMLHRIYQHVRKRSDHLRKALDQATREDAA